MNTTQKPPLLLLILDGWGLREPADDNAISLANTPTWDQMLAIHPWSKLNTSGEAVGLPAGQMGNSEVGHMNIGAGRVVYQDLVRITKSINDGELAQNPKLLGEIEQCKANNATVHLLGMLSPGGVHSHEDHIFALLDILQANQVNSVTVHAILDGRDTPPQSAEPSLQKLQQQLQAFESASLASVSGRFYAMDRDKRWERIEQAWHAVVNAKSVQTAATGIDALQAAYQRDETDEFVQPTLINGGAPIKDGDLVIFANFRADRARQLSAALIQPGFDQFAAASEGKRPKIQSLVTMTNYQDDLPLTVLFPQTRLDQLFGQIVAKHQKTQLRIAETEKYAHVTFFFNGGVETPNPGEDRELVNSPKVKTYDLQPQMSAPELTRSLCKHIESGQYDVIICNVANPDMVGHCGKLDAAIQAVETVDQLLQQVSASIQKVGGAMLITADHGNIEQMSDHSTNQPHTAHTTNPVPLVYVGPQPLRLNDGALCDIAPTMLELMSLPQPADMTGHSLLGS